ncbi:hypothetical protein SNEBB_010957 [Seison nebaliae]|nr:hypothetical protein SNEBB_010957 [Seison nebaliae]
MNFNILDDLLNNETTEKKTGKEPTFTIDHFFEDNRNYVTPEDDNDNDRDMEQSPHLLIDSIAPNHQRTRDISLMNDIEKMFLSPVDSTRKPKKINKYSQDKSKGKSLEEIINENDQYLIDFPDMSENSKMESCQSPEIILDNDYFGIEMFISDIINESLQKLNDNSFNIELNGNEKNDGNELDKIEVENELKDLLHVDETSNNKSSSVSPSINEEEMIFKQIDSTDSEELIEDQQHVNQTEVQIKKTEVEKTGEVPSEQDSKKPHENREELPTITSNTRQHDHDDNDDG